MNKLKELLQRLTTIEELKGSVDSDTLAEVAYWTGYLDALKDNSIELKDTPRGLFILLEEFKV